MEFKSFISVKIVHLVDRSDLFNISNLVYGGYSELADSLFVSVKTDGLGNFLEQLTS